MFRFKTVDDNATAPADYVAVDQDVSFQGATTSVSVTITINGDDIIEMNPDTESFKYKLNIIGTAGTLGTPSSGSVVIKNMGEYSYYFIHTK